MADYELYNDDCLIRMQDIEDNSIQLICTDPPYQSTSCKWDKLPDIDALFEQWKRILKPNGTIVMTMAFPAAIEFLVVGKDIFRQDLVWVKNNKTNFANAHNAHLRQHENILVFSKGKIGSNNKMIYNPQGIVPCSIVKNNKNKNKTICRGLDETKTYVQQYTNYPTTLINISGKRCTKHSTEKPVELFEHLIKTYSNPGDRILDPFCGSGTTGIAALNCNRYPIMIEKDKHWHDVAKDRIESTE